MIDNKKSKVARRCKGGREWEERDGGARKGDRRRKKEGRMQREEIGEEGRKDAQRGDTVGGEGWKDAKGGDRG
jgi:hypothetical protein